MELWMTIRMVWKAAGICFLLFLISISGNKEKLEKVNTFGRQFGKAGEFCYEIFINVIFYGGILLCIIDAMNGL